MTQLSKYLLQEPLGRGSYGTVYRAQDQVLDVPRAVKVLHPPLVADPEFVKRFRDEARLVARLKHRHIVPVYDLGQDQGRIFLAMEYYPGGSLKDYLVNEGPLPFPRAVALLEQIASALDYAHQQGILHRDLKPQNILLDAQGHAALTDFGFAKALSDAGSTGLSSTGGMIGTPAYMPPEIWDGKSWTSAADVYSLACVFFEMITGQVLFEGESPVQVMKKHVLEGPVWPEKWPEGVPLELISILSNALSKNTNERYSNGETFVQMIMALLKRYKNQKNTKNGKNHSEVLHPKESANINKNLFSLLKSLSLQHTKKICWYIPISLLAITFIVSLFFGGIYLINSKTNDFEIKFPSSADVSFSITSLNTNFHSSPISIENAFEIIEYARFGRGEISQIALSPDNNVLAVAGSIGVWLYDKKLEVRHLFAENLNILSIDFSPDGTRLATGSIDGYIKIWDINNYQEIHTLAQYDYEVINRVLFSQDGLLLALASSAGYVELWDTVSYQKVARLTTASFNEIQSMAFLSDGKTLSLVNRDTVTIWDFKTNEENSYALINNSSNTRPTITFSSDGKVLAVADENSIIHIWNTKSNDELTILSRPNNEVQYMAFSPNAKLLALAIANSSIEIWDMTNFKVLTTLSSSMGNFVEDMAFSSEDTLFIASSTGSIEVWSTITYQKLYGIVEHIYSDNCLTFSPNGKFLAFLEWNSVKLWEINTGQESIIFTNEVLEESIISLAFSPNGEILALGYSKGTIKLLEVTTNLELATLIGHSEQVNSLAFSPDGTLLASASNDESIKLWDLTTYQERATFTDDIIKTVIFSPDGTLLISGGIYGYRGAIKIWDLITLQETGTLKDFDEWVLDIASSPDGSLLASSGPLTLILWDIRNSQELSTLVGHTNWVESVAFSPYGTLLASASDDRSIKLWSVNTYQELISLTGHSGGVSKVAFSRNGSLLASVSRDRTVRIWGVKP